MLRRKVNAIKQRMLYFYGFFLVTAVSWGYQARDLYFDQNVHAPDRSWTLPYLFLSIISLAAAYFYESDKMRRIALVTFPAVFVARACHLFYEMAHGDHFYGVSRGVFFLWLATAFSVIVQRLWSLPQEINDYLDLRGEIDATIDEVVHLRAIVAGQEKT